MSEGAPVNLDPAYAGVLVTCPIPGKENLGAQTLGEFMQTEIGQRVGGQALKNVELLLESGMDQDKALTIAFGGAVVTDETGSPLRVPPDELSPIAAPAPAMPGAEKK